MDSIDGVYSRDMMKELKMLKERGDSTTFEIIQTPVLEPKLYYSYCFSRLNPKDMASGNIVTHIIDLIRVESQYLGYIK